MSATRGRAAWKGPVYRRVGIEEVHDRRVIALSDFQFRVWCYCRQGRQSARAGLGPFSIALGAEDLGRSADDFSEALRAVCNALGWTFDADARWLFIPEALAVSWDGSPKQMQGYLNDLDGKKPPPVLLAEFRALIDRVREGKGAPPQLLTEAKAASVWESALAIIEERVQRNHFCTWIQPLSLVDDLGAVIVLRAPSPLHQDWVTRHFGKPIDDAVEQVRAGSSWQFEVGTDTHTATYPHTSQSAPDTYRHTYPDTNGHTHGIERLGLGTRTRDAEIASTADELPAIPPTLHRRFLDMRTSRGMSDDDARSELAAFVNGWLTVYSTGPRSQHPTDGDGFKFWSDRHDESWPPGPPREGPWFPTGTASEAISAGSEVQGAERVADVEPEDGAALSEPPRVAGPLALLSVSDSKKPGAPEHSPPNAGEKRRNAGPGNRTLKC